MKTYSLRRATLRAVVLPLALTIIVTALSAVWLADRAVSGMLDDQMQQEAAFLLLLSRHEAGEGEELGLTRTIESRELLDLLGARTGFRIWSGATLMTQSAANAKPLAGPPPPGFSTLRQGQTGWRTFALYFDALPIVVEVSETDAMRTALTWRLVRSLVLPLLFLILAVGLIAWLQVAQALRPMLRISREIDARDAHDLQPMHGHPIPVEMAPLFEAFNRLITRLGDAITREREFADNAAHELRTPLATLKTRAQVVARNLAGEPEQAAALAHLIDATDRATGIINHLLLLGRLNSTEVPPVRVDLSALAADIARDLAPLAIAKDQQFEADIAADVVIAGQPDPLAMMVRNLIDNAIRYTPAQGSVHIGLHRSGDSVQFSVADTGPGIAGVDIDRVTRRHVRLASAQPGSGLGLSIVRRIVDWHGGSLTFATNTPHGLVATIALPLRGRARVPGAASATASTSATQSAA